VGSVDEAVIRCEECEREVDEFMAAAEVALLV
jgi:hypothetical protein